MTVTLPEEPQEFPPSFRKAAAAAKRKARARETNRQRELRNAALDHADRTRVDQHLPTPELERKHAIEKERTVSSRPGDKRSPTARRVINQTSIDRYLKRELISQRQWDAADKLRDDWHLAGLDPRQVVNLLATGGGNGAGLFSSERQVAAWQRLQRALARLTQRLVRLVIDVVCFDAPAPDAWAADSGSAKCRSTRIVAGLTALGIALDALADHYGL